MSDTKFTEGPWSVCDEAVNDQWHVGLTVGQISKDDSGKVIGGCRIADPCVLTRKCFANAHLIAAAPEMYDALVKTIKTAEESDRWWLDDYMGIEGLKEILKKARGET